MAEKTGIGWTDATFNPWRGCLKKSEACAHCYADAFSHRNPKLLGVFGTEASGGTRVVAADKYWKEPLKWDAASKRRMELWAAKESLPKTEPHRTRVFCASLADVFEDWNGPMHDHKGERLYRNGEQSAVPQWVPGKHTLGYETPVTMGDVRARLFNLIDETPNLTWQLLTKRPENIGKMLPGSIPKLKTALAHEAGTPEANIWHHPNLWLGTTVENQQRADERVPHLLKIANMTPVSFLSMEPLLGPVDLEWPEAINPARMCCSSFDCGCMGQPTEPPLLYFIQWVIVGCESGPHRRHTDLAWVRSLRDQCARWNTPFFVKQLEIDGKVTADVAKFPADLQIQEFPK